MTDPTAPEDRPTAPPGSGQDPPDLTRPLSAHPDERVTMIGPYRVLEPLGEGGFGIVYLAQQQAPIRRKVALKVIKRGMASREIIARFQAEEQALALMNHPGVAKVLDAGTTDDSRPYFVMEHVPGLPITDHCDRHKLSIEERLHLFMQVCEAVQHAHQKGVIHRDLKPSNILVTTTDAGTAPKVIDFGIAKALSQRLTEHTIFTEQGQMIGTPEYMSPEQAERTAHDIDTRSDVYSLGVLLYELLTGDRPFDLKHATLMEIQRRIVKVEPPKPSTRLSRIGDGKHQLAEQRRTDARSMLRRIRGDLDWIVMRCLEKDRARRYETASELAADVRRHLSYEPVQAGPPSAGYRLRKFVRRNRLGVTAAAAIVVVLLAGIGGTSWGLVSAIEARDAEETAKADAEKRADELEQVAAFQSEQLSGIDVELMGVRLRRHVLEEALAAMERSGAGDDDIEDRAAMLEELIAGASFTDIALRTLDVNIFSTALVAVDEQFGDQPLVQAKLFQTLAVTLRDVGLLDAATAPQERALELRRRALGDEHPDTLTSMDNMGFLLMSQGKLTEAEPYWREALEVRRRVLGDEHPDTLVSLDSMGALLKGQGELTEAEPYFREALEVRRQVLGNEHPDTLISIANMGWLLTDQGKLTEAEPYNREALEVRRRVLGDEHPQTLGSIMNMGLLLQGQGKLTEAEPYWREAMEGYRRVLGDEHPKTLLAVNNMGSHLHSRGKLTEAEPYFRETLEVRRRVLGDEHPDTLGSINSVGYMLLSQGKLTEAEPYFREALEVRRRVLGDEHPDTLTSISSMGKLLMSQGKLTDAEPYCREVLEIRRRVLGDEHPDTLGSINRMGSLLMRQGKLTEAEPYYHEALEVRRRVLGVEHPDTLTSISNMGSLLNATERYAESEPLLRDNLPVRQRVSGEDHWRTAEIRSLLGEALAGLDRFDECEPLLLEGCAGLDDALPPDRRGQKLPPALERLARLYEAWEKPEQAAEWQARLDAIETELDAE